MFRNNKRSWSLYVDCFASYCNNDYSDSCHKKYISNSGSDFDKIEECVKDSHLGSKDKCILKAEYANIQLLMHEMVYPVFLINGNTYRVLFV